MTLVILAQFIYRKHFYIDVWHVNLSKSTIIGELIWGRYASQRRRHPFDHMTESSSNGDL